MPAEHSPRVSVIIPTYNRSVYVRQAVGSVFNQTLRNFEILVIDDGSTDDTAQMIKSMADPRLRYLPQANAGRSVARNRGMEVAQGEYIAFLDDDDLYLPHKLEVQVAFLEDHGEVDLVASGTQIVDENEGVIKASRPWLDQPLLTLETCLSACPLHTCSVLFRRAVLTRLDHWFDPAMALAEDTDFFVRLLLIGCRMAWLPEIVSAYRQHSDNSQQDGAKYAASYEYLLNKVFARPDLPASIQSEHDRLYAHCYLYNACRCYDAGQVIAAQKVLQRALPLQHIWAEDSGATLVACVLTFAYDTKKVGSSPTTYIHLVFDNLPDSMKALRRYRKSALSLAHMRRVFAAKANGERPSLVDWLTGIRYDLRWIRNRGVWSILVRDIMGIRPKRVS
jgi:glycosyltransferase involved in cell wall biosynthesis